MKNAELMKGDDVQIAFDDNHAVVLPNALFRVIQAIHGRALLKQRRLAGVEILRLLLVENPAAETDDFSTRVGDGKNQSGKELFIIALGAALSDQTEAQCFLQRQLFLTQKLQQARTTGRGVSQSVCSRGRLIDATGF